MTLTREKRVITPPATEKRLPKKKKAKSKPKVKAPKETALQLTNQSDKTVAVAGYRVREGQTITFSVKVAQRIRKLSTVIALLDEGILKEKGA